MKFRLRNSSNLKQSLSAGISLAVLAVGFTLLGLLSLTNRSHEDLVRATFLENTCCVTGDVISIVAGTIFLLAGWLALSKR
jgi:hypothetical protein